MQASTYRFIKSYHYSSVFCCIYFIFSYNAHYYFVAFLLDMLHFIFIDYAVVNSRNMIKSNKWKCYIFLLILLLCQSKATLRQMLKVEDEQELFLYPVVMPLVIPSINEVYLCTAVDVSYENMSFWIRGFEPRVNNGIVHHMALAGCKENQMKERAPMNVWNCGGKDSNIAIDNSYPTGFVCNDRYTSDIQHDTTLFLWSRNGSELMLPRGVGFKFGARSRIKHLVLQVFYDL